MALRRLAPFFLLLLLSACSLFESPADRAMRASPDFKAGYNDGCGAASTQGANSRDQGLVRDDQSYQGNKAYRTGWNTGFHGCRTVSPQTEGGAGPGITADPNPSGMP